MQSVYLKDYTPKGEGSLTHNSKDLEYEIVTRSDKVSIEENRIVVYDEGASVVFSFEGCPNSETSIRFGNLNYRPLEETDDRADSAQVQLEFTTTAWDKYLLTYSTEYFSFYNDRHDFLRDLGYHEEALSSVSVRFSHPGIYTFDSIAVQALPIENYYEQAKAVQANEVKDDFSLNLEAEEAEYAGNVKLNQDENFSGGAYLNGQSNSPDDAITFKVNLENTGFYRMNFRTRSGDKAARVNYMYIDGNAAGDIICSTSGELSDSVIDNVYIAANSTVIGKVNIGNNVIVGAGSVVVKDIPDNSVVVGNPARVIRSIRESDYNEIM